MQLEQPLPGYNGNPQTEDGYTKIANELFEAVIKFKFTERQYKVFFAIMRKTYGFNKTNDEISLSQLSTLCQLPINHVSTVINQLVSLNIIFKKQGKFAQNLSINKQYDTWGLHNVECHKVELHLVDKGVTSLGVKGFHNVEVQKKTPKENTKEICIECISYLNEKAGRAYKNTDSNIKFLSARLKDGFTVDDIKRVIDLKVKQWIGTEYEKYLRPETLFNATKFASYEQEKPKQQKTTNFENFAVNKLLGKS